MCLGIPGRIESIDEQPELLRNGRVSFGGVVKEINLAFTPEARVGDYIIAHAGIALNTIDEDEAERVFELIEELEAIGDAQSGPDGPA